MGVKHRVSSCFLFLALLGIASGQNYGCGSSPCPQANGLFPVPGDCTSFYNCAHCTAYKQQCGPGTAFDPLLHVCNHINMVDCSGSPSYSQGINERKPSGATGVGYSQSASIASSEGTIDSRSSFSRRHGSVQPSAAADPGVRTTPDPYQSNHRLHSHENTEARQSEVPVRDIHQSGENVRQQGTIDSRSSFSRRYGSVQPSAAADPGVRTTPYPYQSNHGFHSHENTEARQSEVPVRDIYQSGENVQRASSNSGQYRSHQQQDGRTTDEHHHDHHQGSQKSQEPNFNATDRGTVALSARSRFNHSHITHHPEAVSYLPTHQVVYDHSHGEHHHQSGEVHSENEPGELSSNNRGSRPLRKDYTEQASTTTESTTTEDIIPSRGQGFDLKDRYVSNSGFVPSYVPDRMRDETAPKDGSYGEREYVRSPNQKTQSDIRNLQGQPINPNRFYTDDISTPDADSQESPVQLNADDLRHFQQNQAAQRGVPYFEASSNVDRQGRAPAIQPGFRSQYQYREPSSSLTLSSAASSPIGSEVTQSELSPDASGQLFLEHKRRKEPQNSPSVTTDSRGRSVPERRPEAFDASESREHIVYVSAPALPTPLPLVAEQGRKEYHHMGYKFDHDPLRESVKSS